MLRGVTTFALFTAVSASCAENPSLPECAARGSELLQKNAVRGGIQTHSAEMMSFEAARARMAEGYLTFCMLEKSGDGNPRLTSGEGEKMNTTPLKVADCWVHFFTRLQGLEVAACHVSMIVLFQLVIWPINGCRISSRCDLISWPVPSRPLQALKEQTVLSFAEAKKIRSRSKLLIEQKDQLIRNHQADGWLKGWWILVGVILVDQFFWRLSSIYLRYRVTYYVVEKEVMGAWKFRLRQPIIAKW